MRINIAIDGPAGAGKSTVAKDICRLLHYKHLDTGSMYRCVGLKARNLNIDINDDDALEELMANINIEIDEKEHVFLDGVDVSKEIRTDEISMWASNVSSKKIVREALVPLQQKIASKKGYVMDGRDIGTVVLPDAECKLYITASADARAKRRYLENKKRGIKSDLMTLKKEMIERDYQDTHRKVSPLMQAKDAILVDTSDMTKDEVVAYCLQIIGKIIGEVD